MRQLMTMTRYGQAGMRATEWLLVRPATTGRRPYPLYALWVLSNLADLWITTYGLRWEPRRPTP